MQTAINDVMPDKTLFFDIDYSSNKEYWIPINEIKIREEFLR